MLFNRQKLRKGQPLQIFFHIPKTAGSTLNHILTRQYGAEAIYRTKSFYPHSREAELFQARPASEVAATKVFSGHFYFGIHEYLPKPSVQFTLLRDPVEREISNYYHALRDSSSVYHQKYLSQVSSQLSLEKFIGSGFDADLDNLQTRLLAGLNGQNEAVPYGQCSEEMLERAISHLSSHFVFAGITEEFDASVLLLKNLLGWKQPYYCKENIGSNRPPMQEIPQAALDAIYANTHYDRRLYAHVAREFHALVAAQSQDFHAQLARFPEQNDRYWRLKQPAISAVNALRKAAVFTYGLLPRRLHSVQRLWRAR